MIKVGLSIEQMQKLESLGLDTSDASLVWVNHLNSPQLFVRGEIDDIHGFITSYTLTDILKKLPFVCDASIMLKPVIDENGNKKWWCGYSWEPEDEESLFDTPEDAAYDKLVYCLEHKETYYDKIQ